MDPSLLKPSLDDRRFKPIYSASAMFAAAFFGGGFAVLVVAAANSQRLGRLQRDALWLALGGLFTASAAWIALKYSVEGSRELRIASLGTGFLTWGLFHTLHGKMHRAMQTFGTKPPTPYLMVIGAVAFGIAMAALITSGYAAFTETTP